jgi:DNA invertase Pin-like site-specific DNA recombinase
MTIYGYARESTRKQELGLTAQLQELKKSGCHQIIQDLGQSGETNLIESEAWLSIADRIEPGDTLKVWSQSRLGRESYEVSFVIGRLTKRGIAVHILEEGRVISDLDNFNQNATMTLKGLTDHNERVEIKKRTKKALTVLKDAGVTLGRKPALTAKDIAKIQELRLLGIGYASIGKVVQWRSDDGMLHITDPRTVKAGLSPGYITREKWDRRNQIARLTLLGTDRT